jgi:hypothetical protein
MAFNRVFVCTLLISAVSCIFDSQSFPQSREAAESSLSVEPIDLNIDERDIRQVVNMPSAARVNPTCPEDRTSDLASHSILEGAILRIGLRTPLKLSKLKTGSSFGGVLLRSLYSQENEIVPAGAHVWLVVDTVERQRTSKTRALGWLRRIWVTFPKKTDRYSVSFRSATLTLSGGSTIPVSLVFGGMAEPTLVQRKLKKADATTPAGSVKHSQGSSLTSRLPDQRKERRPSILILKLAKTTTVPWSATRQAHSIEDRPLTGASVTRARLSLLTLLSASKNHEGDWFRARLVEPVWLEGRVLLEGTLFEGRIARQAPPRRLLRPGLLYVNFERIIPPVGASFPISSSIVSIEADRKARLKMDSEGMLRGRNPGIAAVAIDVGLSYVFAKVLDDLLEEGIKAFVTGVTSESAASISRYFGIGAGVCLLLARRGRDVTLEEYSEFEVSFRRQADFQPR